MRRLHRMILRNLPGPFLGWLGTLMFLLLMQFLIKYLPDLAGKGLPLGVIIELIAYNLSYMLVLAVPMSALISTLMVFGKLAESNAYAVIKNAGISLPQLLWPMAVAGLLLTGVMTYFNNEVLPEANFRAKNLWQDIRSKKPGFELQPGIFYEGINDYSILVRERPPDSNELFDVLIYDYTENRQRTIKAKRGHLKSIDNGAYIDIVLEDGEIHQLIPTPTSRVKERYERLVFERYRMRLDLTDFAFERSDPRESYRSDRTTPTLDMIRYVDSLEASVAATKQKLRRATLTLGADSVRDRPLEQNTLPVEPAFPDTAAPTTTSRPALIGLGAQEQQRAYQTALQHARTRRSTIDDARRTITWESQRADRYRVEIHKKFSIALACLIFILIGAPLGLSIRRGSLGAAGALALGIFLFYWITLVQGEKFADRGMLPPWIGMWIANIVMTLVSIWLLVYVTIDLRATPPLRTRLWNWLRST